MTGKSNMYTKSVKQWNPFVGCRFDCSYCFASFRRQIRRWGKKHCQKCYNFEPHFHPERLTQWLPRTKPGEFIFACAMGDVAFAERSNLYHINSLIWAWPDRTFLLQSKNPSCFSDRQLRLPDNVILGTTIETNRDKGYDKISKAPPPSQRFAEFLEVKHPRKMLTIEPIMDFDLDVMAHWIRQVNPETVWIGYDSKKTGLPEPPLSKTQEIVRILQPFIFTKTMRPSLQEKPKP